LDTARLMHDLDVDIAVDLTGVTEGHRLGILAMRPARIHVNYLGYPGTIGSDRFDYIIADSYIVPARLRGTYGEKVVYLPDTFQANDSKRPIPARAPSRREAGLPEGGVVFCCFNQSFKILPAMFDVWMRLVREVEDSVLWMLAENPTTATNLQREAHGRGVSPDRLVFAPRVGYADYLARYGAADLFL